MNNYIEVFTHPYFYSPLIGLIGLAAFCIYMEREVKRAE